MAKLQLAKRTRPKSDERPALFGGNARLFNSRDREVLLAGAAGTGKTLAAFRKLYEVGEKYPHARLLVIRKTRRSLVESGLVTWEEDILGSGHPMLAHAIQRPSRHSYQFPNGSTLVVGGMDKPDKVLSSQWDVIYVQEATELSLTDWETLGTRLRNGRVPYQQIIADCNPSAPTHWLHKRGEAGSLTMLRSTHRDNPRFWDHAAGRWTKDGEEYLARLGTLTGIRRKRFLEGVWAQAEGVVYEEWNPDVHLVNHFTPPKEWRRFHSVDFGFTNPLAYQFWAEDPDGRLYLYRERYKTGLLVEDVAKWTKADIAGGLEPRPAAVVGDHDAEDRATFERHSGLAVRPADKKVLDGIQDVAGRLRVAGDGKPRLFVMRGARCHPADRVLVDAGKPTCTADEFDGYVWDDKKTRETPVKEGDHGLDAARYLVRYVESHQFGPAKWDHF